MLECDIRAREWPEARCLSRDITQMSTLLSPEQAGRPRSEVRGHPQGLDQRPADPGAELEKALEDGVTHRVKPRKSRVAGDSVEAAEGLQGTGGDMAEAGATTDVVCGSCGESADANEAFCTNCGAALAAGLETSVPARAGS